MKFRTSASLFLLCLNVSVPLQRFISSAQHLTLPVFERLLKNPLEIDTWSPLRGTYYKGTAVFRSAPVLSPSTSRAFVLADPSISTPVLRCGVDVPSGS